MQKQSPSQLACVFILCVAGMTLFARRGQGDSTQMRLANELSGMNGRIVAAGFGPDDKSVLAGGWDGVWIWDRKSQDVIRHFADLSDRSNSMIDAVACMAVSSKRDRIICGDRTGNVGIWNASDGIRLHDFQGGENAAGIASVAISADGLLALSGAGYPLGSISSNEPTEFPIRLWNIGTQALQKSFIGHQAAVTGVSFLPDGKRILSASDDQTLRVWDIASGNETNRTGEARKLPRFERGGKSYVRRPKLSVCLSVASDGRTVIWGSTLWDVDRWQSIHSLLGDDKAKVLCGAFSPDSTLMLTGHENGKVRLWNVQDRKVIATVYGHVNHAPVLAVGFSADGKFVVTAGEGGVPGINAILDKVPASDRMVRVWQLLNK